MVMVVREQRQGDMGGSSKTRNDNKAGYKHAIENKKKYGKEGKKKDAEEKPRSPWHSG